MRGVIRTIVISYKVNDQKKVKNPRFKQRGISYESVVRENCFYRTQIMYVYSIKRIFYNES